MKKLRLVLDELNVETFRPVTEQPSLQGTVRANSGCRYSDIDCTQYYSTCDTTATEPSCDGCASYPGGCLSGGGGCIALYTYEESYCVCTNQYSCECAFSEASNCHRCTGP